MSRGRRPHVALGEAEDIAAKRGEVRVFPGSRGDSFDLMIFEAFRTVFVKVKRSLTKFSWPMEILHQYQREVAHVHRVPLTAVTAREFWLRHPNGTWQFFLIRHDSVVEVRADGTFTPPAELPVPVRSPAGGESGSEGDSGLTPDDPE